MTNKNEEAESPDSTPFGNRPATGARLVDHTAGLASTFGGGQEATDFLGLSQELGGGDSASAAGSAHAPAARDFAAPSEGSASWLLSEERRAHAAAPSEDEAEDFETEDVAATEESGRSRRILSVVAAVLVIGAAVTVATRLGRNETPATNAPLVAQPRGATGAPDRGPDELANPAEHRPSGRETILPGGETVPVEPADPATATTTAGAETSVPVEVEPVEPTPVEPPPPARLGAERLARWMKSHGWMPSPLGPESDIAGGEPGIPSTPPGFATVAILAFASSSRVATPSAEWVSPDVPSSVDEVPLVIRDPAGNPLSPFAPSDRKEGGDVPSGALRFATQEDLANVWGSNLIPFDAVGGEVRIVTPVVGFVRVVLTSSEIFDGRLYAVGQGQVWIETDIGRLAIGANRILRIDQVVSEQETKLVDTLPRMRVRTPGGLFFGKILARDEEHVTLLLDGGGRIRLESSDVEPAPLGDTRVIGPVKP